MARALFDALMNHVRRTFDKVGSNWIKRSVPTRLARDQAQCVDPRL